MQLYQLLQLLTQLGICLSQSRTDRSLDQRFNTLDDGSLTQIWLWCWCVILNYWQWWVSSSICYPYCSDVRSTYQNLWLYPMPCNHQTFTLTRGHSPWVFHRTQCRLIRPFSCSALPMAKQLDTHNPQCQLNTQFGWIPNRILLFCPRVHLVMYHCNKSIRSDASTFLVKNYFL